MDKKIKIIFILPSLRGGGAERVIINIIKNINRKMFKVILISCCIGDDYIEQVPLDVKLIKLNKKRVLFSIPKLTKIIFCEKPDILFSALPHVNIITLMCKYLSFAKSRVIISEHNTYSMHKKNCKNKIKTKLINFLIKLLYRYVDKIVFVSRGSLHDFSNNFKNINYNKAHVIYNPAVNDDIYVMKKEEIELDKNYKYIIAVGRLTKQKDYPNLLNAFKIVTKEIKNIKLIILGKGEDKDKLIQLCEKLEIEKNVEFMGFQKNPFKFMANSDVYVLSSEWEGFGNTIVEAMACGIPVISTNCPSGPNEIISNRVNGLLVPPKDSLALARSILRVLQDKEFANNLKRNALERAKDFHISKIVKEYEELFIETLSKK